MTSRQRIKQHERREFLVCICACAFVWTTAALLIMAALV
jgi:hypothetical protein